MFCFWFPQRASYQWRCIPYKLMIFPLISQCGTLSQQSSTHLRSMDASFLQPYLEQGLVLSYEF